MSEWIGEYRGRLSEADTVFALVTPRLLRIPFVDDRCVPIGHANSAFASANFATANSRSSRV